MTTKLFKNSRHNWVKSLLKEHSYFQQAAFWVFTNHFFFQFSDSHRQIPCERADLLKSKILLQKVFQPIINHTNSYNKSRIQFYICLVIHQVSPNFDSTYLHVTVYSIGRHWVQAQWDEIFLGVAFIFLCFYRSMSYSSN